VLAEEGRGRVELPTVLAERPGKDDAALAGLGQVVDRDCEAAQQGLAASGKPTAIAPGQSSAAQTSSGRTSIGVQVAAKRRRRSGPAKTRRPSPGSRSGRRRSTRKRVLREARVARGGFSALLPGRWIGTSSSTEPGAASATSVSPSSSPHAVAVALDESGRSSGGGERSVTSAPAAEERRDPSARVAPVRRAVRPVEARVDRQRLHRR
jgi:hypothetical protein